MDILDAGAFAEYWDNVRRRTRRVAVLIPAEQLEWTPAPGKWSMGDVVRHLASIERDMYAENVEGRPSRYPGHGPELAGGLEAVLAYSDRKHAESLAIFRALTPAQLEAK